jgi:DNA-binding CsgD family transcriptional regulator
VLTQVLLERDDELRGLARALRDAETGAGSLVVISGPLGNGKSTLLQALPELGRRAGARVLRASASALEQDFAFGVVRQIFEPAVSAAEHDARRRWLAGEAGLARVVVADDSLPAGGQFSVIDPHGALGGLRALVENISSEGTLLILVDDLQWTDGPSLRWLGYLARRLERLRVLLVVTLREGDLGSDGPLISEIVSSAACTLRPGALSVDATRALVREHLGEAGDEQFVHGCHETTDGNPLFLMSVLLNLAINGVRPVSENVGTARSLRPAQLRDRLISCLNGQPESVREFAKAMTVLGEHTELELIGRLAGLDHLGCTEALRTMYHLGLLVSEREPRFLHLVVRDAVEASMTLEEREQAHLRAVELLYSCGCPAEQVAAQLLAVMSPLQLWAIGVLRTAAETAARRGAPEVAARYLRRALLDTSLDGEDRAALLIELATVERSFDFSASLRHISYAMPLFRTARARADAVMRIAPAVLDSAMSPAIDLARRAAGELGDPEKLSGADRELTLRLEARVRYCETTDPAQLVDAVERLHRLGPNPPLATGAERELLAVLLHAATLAVRMPAREVSRLATRILEHEPASPGHVYTALPLVVNVLATADSVTGLTSWLEMTLEQARRQHSTPLEKVSIKSQLALVLWQRGLLSKAVAIVDEVSESAAAEPGVLTPRSAVGLAGAAMEARDERLVKQLLAHHHPYDNSNGAMSVVWRMLRGSAADLSGDPQSALEQYLDAGRELKRFGWRNTVVFPWRALSARLYQRLGDVDAARELVDEDRALSAAWGSPAMAGRALRLSAMLAAGDKGTALLRDAVDVLEASGNMLERARVHVMLGSRLRAAGKRDADDHLSRGGRLATECGAVWLTRRAAAELGAAASRSPKNDRPALTRAEHKVALLAADGYTNREIAEEFAVSTRSVEKHLTNSYKKLGVRRRDELAEALRILAKDDASREPAVNA